MKKLITIFLILHLTTLTFGQWSGRKSMLGRQINKAHQLGDPVAFWLSNEGSGNKVFDLSGNGNTGILQGTTPSWTSGKYGSAVLLPGTDEYIDCGNKEILRILGDVTLIVSFKINNIVSNSYIAAWEGNSEDENLNLLYGFNLRDGGDIFIGHEYGGGSNEINTYNTNLSTGIYYILACTRNTDSKVWKLYVNGVQFGADFNYTNQATGGTVADFHIGRNASGVEFDGIIDFATIYNRTFSASEIALLYREPFCMFKRDDIALMEAAIPTVGGQVIIISKAVVSFILVISLILIKRRKAA